MIKNIIFDIGGVYLEGNLKIFLDKVCLMLNSKNNLYKNDIVFNKEYNQGLISPDECFRKIFKSKKLSEKDLRKIKQIWTNNWKINPEMKKITQKLKNNYKLIVLSNSDILNSQKYKKQGWYDDFDATILSHEVGITKPNKKIYEIMLKKLLLKPNECVFIDDQIECLEPAKKIGIKTILFKSAEDLELRLSNLGVIFNKN